MQSRNNYRLDPGVAPLIDAQISIEYHKAVLDFHANPSAIHWNALIDAMRYYQDLRMNTDFVHGVKLIETVDEFKHRVDYEHELLQNSRAQAGM